VRYSSPVRHCPALSRTAANISSSPAPSLRWGDGRGSNCRDRRRLSWGSSESRFRQINLLYPIPGLRRDPVTGKFDITSVGLNRYAHVGFPTAPTYARTRETTPRTGIIRPQSRRRGDCREPWKLRAILRVASPSPIKVIERTPSLPSLRNQPVRSSEAMMLNWAIGFAGRGFVASLGCMAVGAVALAQDTAPIPAPPPTAVTPAQNTAAVPPRWGA